MASDSRCFCQLPIIQLSENYDTVDSIQKLFFLSFVLSILLTSLSFKLLSKSRLHGSTNTIQLSHSKLGTLSLDQFLRKSCPQLFCYNPTPYLFNSDLQTITASEYSTSWTVDYEEQHWKALDGGTIAVHFYPAEKAELPSDLPFVVLFHGLTGNSKEPYVKTIVRDCQDSSGQYRYRCAVIHGRGCGGAVLTSLQTHAPGYTGDARYVIDKLRKSFSFSPFILVGFSLGANVMINYLGEEGEQLNRGRPGDIAKVVGAISLGNPFDIYICSHSLESTMFRKYTYAKKIARKLTKYFNEAITDFRDHPSITTAEILRSQTPRQFDDRVTRKVFGYPTVNQYYRECGCSHRIVDIRVPTLFINSIDDPISVWPAIPYDEIAVNPYTVLLQTSKGGHCGWFTGWTPRYWFGDFVPNLISLLSTTIVDLDGTEVLKSQPLTESEQIFHRKRKSSVLARRLSDKLQTYDSSETAQIHVLYELWKDINEKGF